MTDFSRLDPQLLTPPMQRRRADWAARELAIGIVVMTLIFVALFVAAHVRFFGS